VLALCLSLRVALIFCLSFRVFCLSFRSEAEESAFAFALTLAFLVVIPEGNLRLSLCCHPSPQRTICFLSSIFVCPLAGKTKNKVKKVGIFLAPI
jgi:hypothetical protein